MELLWFLLGWLIALSCSGLQMVLLGGCCPLSVLDVESSHALGCVLRASSKAALVDSLLARSPCRLLSFGGEGSLDVCMGAWVAADPTASGVQGAKRARGAVLEVVVRRVG